MIDKKVMQIAKERISIEVAEQSKGLSSEIQRIYEEMSARGTLSSGMTITRVTKLCVATIQNRAQLIWQILFRFITTAGISYSPELVGELKELVDQYLPEKLGEFKGYVKKTTEMARSPRMYEKLEKNLDEGRKQALAKVGTEIDLFVHQLKNKAEGIKNGVSSTVVNIYSPVASIQTGDHATANVSQVIDDDVKGQILKVLEEISLKLTQPEVEISSPKDELLEVVQESQMEVNKEKPNVTRLKSLLTTVGTSIQLVSSLKPAYEGLKQVLTFLGISLP